MGRARVGRGSLVEVALRADLSIRRAAMLLAALLGLVLAFAPRAEAFLYWSTDGAAHGGVGIPPPEGWIGRANLDGTGPDNSLIRVPGIDTTDQVQVDGSHLYWTDVEEDAIGRAKLDGTGVDRAFIAVPPDPNGAHVLSGIAIDGSHIYWTRSGFAASSGSIGRANLDGTGVDQSFIANLDSPVGLAVDGSHIYFGDYRPSTQFYAMCARISMAPAWIRSSSMRGSLSRYAGRQRELRVLEPIRRIRARVFGNIRRATLDGSLDLNFLISTGTAATIALVDLTTSAVGLYIRRANLDGTDDTTLIPNQVGEGGDGGEGTGVFGSPSMPVAHRGPGDCDKLQTKVDKAKKKVDKAKKKVKNADSPEAKKKAKKELKKAKKKLKKAKKEARGLLSR